MIIIQCSICKALSEPTAHEWQSKHKRLSVQMPRGSAAIHICPACVEKLNLFDEEKSRDPKEEFLDILQAIIDEVVDDRMSK